MDSGASILRCLIKAIFKILNGIVNNLFPFLHCTDFINANVTFKEVCLAIWVLEQHDSFWPENRILTEFPLSSTQVLPSLPSLKPAAVLHPQGAGCEGKTLSRGWASQGIWNHQPLMFITSHPAKSHNLLDNLGSVYRSGHPSRYIVAVHLLSLLGAQLRQLRTWNLKTWTLLLVHFSFNKHLELTGFRHWVGGQFLISGPPSKATLSVEGTQEAMGEDQLIH